MNTFLCLAITFLLAGLMFIYVRNQMTALESKVFHLTEAVRSLAEPLKEEVTAEEEPVTEQPLLKRCYVSDDSESESDEEDDHGATVIDLKEFNDSDTKFVELKEMEPVRMIPISMSSMIQMMNMPLEFEKMQETTIDLDNLQPLEDPINEVIEVETTVSNFDTMTMKELKELATAKGAPSSIRSRKALIEFLSA